MPNDDYPQINKLNLALIIFPFALKFLKVNIEYTKIIAVKPLITEVNHKPIFLMTHTGEVL